MGRPAAAEANGWTLDDRLVAPSLVALAAPVRDPDGLPVCAISVLAHTSRHGGDELREHALTALTALTEAAGAIADELYGTPPGSPPPRATHAYIDAKSELGPSFLQALARGLAVLTVLGRRRGGLTLVEAAEAPGSRTPGPSAIC